MNKRLTKPHEKNVRLNSPLGLLGVPPDCLPCCRVCCRYCYGWSCKRNRRTLTQ